MEELIGRPFKVNLKGISTWSDTIASYKTIKVAIVGEGKFEVLGYRPVVLVTGERGIAYKLEDLVLTH